MSIAGDFFLGRNNFEILIDHPENCFRQSIVSLLQKSDYNILNLECPLTDAGKEDQIPKTGPSLKAGPQICEMLKDLNVKLVTIANNHIMDYGLKGLSDTIQNCNDKSIGIVGAGLSLEEARRPFTINRKGVEVGVLNFAENEWASAEEGKPGANPLDLIDNVGQIRSAKENSDFVIVIIHGGHEYYHLPSPRMVKQYRFYAENGASVIVGHHSHCISGYEVHQGVPIFYGLGNFLFAIKSEYDPWYTGLVLQLDIGPDKSMRWELLPVQQSKADFKVELLVGQQARDVLAFVDELSVIIRNEQQLKEHWDFFVKEKEAQYVSNFGPASMIQNKYLRAGLRRSGIERLFLRREYLKKVLNIIRCEAHADVCKEAIANFLTGK